MKKILIIAYDFPPYVSAGGLRPYSWYLNLKKFGYEPVVITRQWENKYGDQRDYISQSATRQVEIEKTEYGTLIKTPYKPNLSQRLLLKYGENRFVIFRKSLTLFFELAQYILPIGPKKQLYLEAKKYLSKNKVDLILATGEPFVLFMYASKLSKKYNTKWVADYRDPWSQAAWRKSNFLMARLNKYFEHKAITTAHAICTVSPYVETVIRSNIPNKTPIHIQSNGYDSEIFDQKELEPPSETMVITFAGSVYPWHPLKNVLNTLDRFIRENSSSSIEINLIGTNKESELMKYISAHCKALEQVVKHQSRMPNAELANKLLRSHLLLLFNDHALLGTKIFNYMAAKRPILLCYTNCSETNELRKKNFAYDSSDFDKISLQKELIEKTNSGIAVGNSEHLLEILKKYQAELALTGKIASKSHSIEQYSRINQVTTFAKFLDTL